MGWVWGCEQPSRQMLKLAECEALILWRPDFKSPWVRQIPPIVRYSRRNYSQLSPIGSKLWEVKGSKNRYPVVSRADRFQLLSLKQSLFLGKSAFNPST